VLYVRNRLVRSSEVQLRSSLFLRAATCFKTTDILDIAMLWPMFLSLLAEDLRANSPQLEKKEEEKK